MYGTHMSALGVDPPEPVSSAPPWDLIPSCRYESSADMAVLVAPPGCGVLLVLLPSGKTPY